MKTETLSRDTHFSGSERSTEMVVETSAKIIGVLVDSMYSNKPQSIYREMVSNAWDAHREAGTEDIPFDVTMPGLFSPKFSLRDYGTGLSHSFMMDGYCRVGHSTKENTNLSVGKWGLGRLVPLSYTETYSLTSWYNGFMRNYSIVRSDKGIECVPMGGSPSQEPSGVEISFPIKKEDLHRFKGALEYVSLGLSVKPRVLGQPETKSSSTSATHYQWPEIPVSVSGENWQYLNNSLLPYESPLKNRFFVKMGCVLYPIDNSQFDIKPYNESAILEAPIGSLAVTSSRESLSYGSNEPTHKTISLLLENFYQQLVQNSVEQLADCKSYLEACRFFDNICNTLRGPAHSAFVQATHSEWQGYPLPRGYVFTGGDTQEWGWEYSAASSKRVQITKSNNSVIHTRLIDKSIAAVVENLTPGERDVRGPKRILQWWKSFADEDRPQNLVWFQYDAADKSSVDELIRFTALFPDVPLYSVKDDCPDTFVPATKGQSRPVQLKKLSDGATHWQYHNEYNLSSTEFQAGGYYQKTERNEPVYQNKLVTNQNLQYAQRLRCIDFPVYIVPKTLWKRFEEAPQWKEIQPHLVRLIGKHRKGLTVSAKTRNSGNRDDSLKPFIDCDKLIEKYYSLFDEKEYLSTKSSSTSATPVSATWCARILSAALGDTSTYDRAAESTALRKEILQKYPLLNLTGNYRAERGGGYIPEFKQYISLMKERNHEKV